MSPIVKTLFGVGAVGVATAALILSGGDPEVDPLPTPPPLVQNDAGYYFATLCVEATAARPRERCHTVVTKDLDKAKALQEDGAYVGSHFRDIVGHPASLTEIWGNPRPGRPPRP